MRFGFIGPASAVQSPLVSAEALVNLYVEQSPSPNARTPYALYPTPGLSLFATLIGPSVRGSLTVSGRTFKVSGTHLYEMTASGGVTDYGGNPGTANNNMLDDGLPAVMVAGGNVGGNYPSQILIASGGTLTVFNIATNTFSAITAAPANVLMVAYVDGFFIALTSNNTFQISNTLDATTWTGLAISQVSVFSDQLLSILESNRLLWIFGAKKAVVYYNSGKPVFPFDVVNGGFLEVGIQAQFSPARVASKQGTTICWLSGDERGTNMVHAASGFNPQRVSDHALEYWMSQQTSVSDAVGYAMQDQGHNFYVLYFPTANATWALDVDLMFWHRRSSLVAGVQAAHLGRCHTFNFNQHLVGDRRSGNVYSMSINYFNENVGISVFNPIIRTRIGPSVANETAQVPIPINEFEVLVEAGLGPNAPLTDANGLPRDPLMMVSYSEDFGKTWGPERMIPCGQAGNFRLRAIDRRLGSWESWTPKVTVSDPIPWRFTDAIVNGTQDNALRLAKQYAKVN